MTTPLDRLGQHVKRRRLELHLARDKAARSVDMSKDTWKKVENGESVRALSYSRIEQALQWAPGTCDAILAGGEPITIERTAGGVLSHVPNGALEDEVRQAVTNATIATTTTLTAGEIRELNERVVEELRKRGILEDAPEQAE